MVKTTLRSSRVEISARCEWSCERNEYGYANCSDGASSDAWGYLKCGYEIHNLLQERSLKT